MDPDYVERELERAARLLESGQPDDCVKCLDELEAALVEESDRVEWATLRASALSELGRIDDAIETLNPLLEEHPHSARLFGTLGVVLSNGHDLEGARQTLEYAISLDSDDEALIANLALVYERLHDYRRAVELYDRALELGADIDWILARKATALGEAGDYPAARATLKRYLSLSPEDSAQWVSLAILYSDDSKFDEAFERYRAAERLDPRSSALRLNWGVTAVRAGKLKIARRQLKHLQRLEPQSTRPLLLRAFIVEEEGNVKGADALYGTVLEKVTHDNYEELTYALEMAMDFYARRKMRSVCEGLLKRAYQENACTVELCEAYRERFGRTASASVWFNVLVECRYRRGLFEVLEHGADEHGPFTHFLRNVQVIARDRDDAVAQVHEFLARMGEQDVRIRELLGEEELPEGLAGLYEVEREALVVRNDA